MNDDVEILNDEDSIEASNEILSNLSSKKHKNSNNNKLIISNIKLILKKLIFIVLLFVVLFFFIFGFTRISDISMSPNIAAGDLLIYYRLDKNYTVGDVVTFKKDNKRYVLRILALEGQTVSLNQNNDFLIDGEIEYHKTYFENNIPKKKGIKYPYKVPKGKVFVVGDYRSKYDDSRTFGAIDKSIIDGKIISLIQTKDI